MTLTFGSLFAGIGGIDLGLERAGMECRWQVEIDEYCLRVLEKHWPDVRRYKDVREIGKHNLEPVDLIAGGFPCQPHSIAGKRKGAEDDRNLWPEFIRIIRETKPRYIIAENVPGIITTYLDTVLSDMEGAGYTCWTFNIPACAFDAPHRRERIFVLANTTRKRWGGGSNADVQRQSRTLQATRPRSRKEQRFLADTTEQGLEGQVSAGEHRGEQGLFTERNWWTVEPNVGRVVDGVPKRVDRLRALGNAVVPQVAQYIGEKIMEVEHEIQARNRHKHGSRNQQRENREV